MKARSALLFIAVLSAPLRAQDSGSTGDSTCIWARPLPTCRVVLLTNAGVYLNPAPAWGESQLRAIADWGLIVNSGRHDAVGASWFVMLDADEFSTGPVLRYRRWFSERRSLDLTVGTPVSTGGDLMVGSVLGMIKYNPEDWVGFALRPELVRRRYSTSGRVYAGAEVGSSPGLTLTIGGGIVMGLLAILAAAVD
jgi:hypothetical protein